MQSISKQRGLTAISWMVIITAIVLFSIFILRLIPIYLDGYSVAESVKFLGTEKKLIKYSNKAIKKALLKKLNINSVYSVVEDDIFVTKKAKYVIVEVDYEVRENLIGNLDFVVSFNSEVTIK